MDIKTTGNFKTKFREMKFKSRILNKIFEIMFQILNKIWNIISIRNQQTNYTVIITNITFNLNRIIATKQFIWRGCCFLINVYAKGMI